jgi:16S rRNA (guanine966-N2)-methyltransferase
VSSPRVITGSAGGLYLKVPKGFPSRPTQDRVKQAIYSSLGALVPGSRVLDLFAGTGALGIEALSRGADSAFFVEKDARTAAVLKENLAHCHLTADVRTCSVQSFLGSYQGEPFDLIFLDPPYAKDHSDLAKSDLVPLVFAQLAPGGRVIWEHDAGNTWSDSDHFPPPRTVRYGATAVSYLQATTIG